MRLAEWADAARVKHAENARARVLTFVYRSAGGGVAGALTQGADTRGIRTRHRAAEGLNEGDTIMINHSSKAALIAASIVVALTGTPALAQTVSKSVSYAGLDLSTPSGQHRLDHMVAAAVGEICGIDYERDLTVSMATNACRRAAMASARPQMARAFAKADEGRRAVDLASR